jgi:Caspase domain
VAWTPEGYYAASLNGDRYIGWHVNRGVDQAAEYYSAAQFKSQFYRPDVVHEYLRTRGDLALALKTANEKRGGGVGVASNAAAPNILSIIPPVVFIRSPKPDESAVENGILTVEAEAEAAPNTLPVSSLKVLLNGLQVAATKGVQLEVQVPLRPGSNTIEVIAANEKAVSAPKTKKVLYTGQPAGAAKPNLIFLALGVAEYARPEFTLKFAAQDALQMAERFKAQEGGFFNQVKIEALTDKQVTREAVIDKLDWLTREAKQDDVVALYLSGHAGTHRNNYYFYTHLHDPNVHPERYDVKWSTLMDALSAAPRTKRILFVDTCRAGAATGGVRAKGDEGLLEALKDLQQSYQGVVFFAASANNELSVEKDELNHGLFTYALLEGLKGNADVMKRDQIIYINELGNFVRDRVKQLSGGAQHAIYYEPPPESGFQPFPLFVLSK